MFYCNECDLHVIIQFSLNWSLKKPVKEFYVWMLIGSYNYETILPSIFFINIIDGGQSTDIGLRTRRHLPNNFIRMCRRLPKQCIGMCRLILKQCLRTSQCLRTCQWCLRMRRRIPNHYLGRHRCIRIQCLGKNRRILKPKEPCQ